MTNNTDFRIERDSMGDRQIHNNVYYGIQTQRAVENFPISGLQPLPTYVNAGLYIKKATAIVNGELNCIPADISKAIIQAVGSVCSRCLPSRSRYIPPHEH